VTPVRDTDSHPNAGAQLPALELIRRKRDGEELTEGEIDALVQGIARRAVPEYQVAAFLMAVYFRGLSTRELARLTYALAHSGRLLDLSSLPHPTADKHSTGGVGDKISLPLAPLVACEGVCVPMLSGRGLGHTGGTLDKLEAIPGYRTRLSGEEFVSIVRRVGCSIAGQSEDLAPADGVLYELRDVTATVESLPLIVSSIASKKIAAGPASLVYDVKVGRGAFLRERARAEELARRLVETTAAAGRRAVAVLTDMDSPLGRAVGNANEVAESVAILRGEGPGDVREVTLGLGAVMLVLAGVARDREEATARLARRITSGSGFARFRAMAEAHGADLRALDDTTRLPRAACVAEARAPRAGGIATLDALAVGRAAVALGAGRERREDTIDPGAGIDITRHAGDRVDAGETVAFVRARTPDLAAQGARAVEAAYEIGETAAPSGPRLLGLVTLSGQAAWDSTEADDHLARSLTHR
jgi:pyrimidine-nucleoside phosphorylase